MENCGARQLGNQVTHTRDRNLFIELREEPVDRAALQVTTVLFPKLTIIENGDLLLLLGVLTEYQLE